MTPIYCSQRVAPILICARQGSGDDLPTKRPRGGLVADREALQLEVVEGVVLLARVGEDVDAADAEAAQDLAGLPAADNAEVLAHEAGLLERHRHGRPVLAALAADGVAAADARGLRAVGDQEGAAEASGPHEEPDVD